MQLNATELTQFLSTEFPSIYNLFNIIKSYISVLERIQQMIYSHPVPTQYALLILGKADYKANNPYRCFMNLDIAAIRHEPQQFLYRALTIHIPV